jgi:hypothetical protein
MASPNLILNFFEHIFKWSIHFSFGIGLSAAGAGAGEAGLFLAVLLRFTVFLEDLWHFPVLGGHLREPGGQRGILYIYTHILLFM